MSSSHHRKDSPTYRLLSTETHRPASISDPPPTATHPRASPKPAPAARNTSESPPEPRKRPLPVNFGRNQIIPMPPDLERDCNQIINHFKAPIRYAFGYGSGVLPQKSYAKDAKPMLDFVFAVSHPSHWHSINLQQNPHHYALPLRWFGSGPISWLQVKGPGAGVWFNVEVEVAGRVIKYGVVSVDTLCNDLLDWETLYLAGRMQKPVHILRDDARVRLANQVNLASALRTALLTLPSTFTETDLFIAVAGLSYRGDFRMRLGENPKKVSNIVNAQLGQFRSLYGPLIRAFKSVSHIGGVTQPGLGEVRKFEQDVSPFARSELARKLPVGLRDKIEADYDRKWNLQRAQRRAALTEAAEADEVGAMEEKEQDEKALFSKVVQDGAFDESLARGLALIVGRPTFNQSLKGILSAGMGKSFRYIGPKLRKRWEKGPSEVIASPKETKEEAATPKNESPSKEGSSEKQQ